MNLLEIRKAGIGSNFTVSNASDGYRKDNSVWFGTCDTCGEQVSSSVMSTGWTHSVVVRLIGTTGKEIKSVDYCPKG